MSHAARVMMKVGKALVATSVVASVLVLLALGVGPRTGRYRTLTVLTGSMEPGIPAGSVVFVTPQSPRSIRPGQILSYNAPIEDGRVVTHRVVNVREAGMHPILETKGDANAAPDPWRAKVEDSVVWRVRLSIPFLGRGIQAMRSRGLRTVTVWVFPWILAAVWIRDVWRKPPRKDEARGDGALDPA